MIQNARSLEKVQEKQNSVKCKDDEMDEERRAGLSDGHVLLFVGNQFLARYNTANNSTKIRPLQQLPMNL